MILECSDLERALRTPELMPDMRAHAEQCAACREQLHLWGEISRLAPCLHEEWESPFLWPRIQANLSAEPALRRRAPWGRWALAAAGVVVLAVAVLQPMRSGKPTNRDFLTESALQEVQQAERVYARSIEKLSAVAAQDLERSSSPLAAAYREKLALLDSGIAELKATVESNRYNTYLQTELAALYRQKQLTLQEWLQNANHN
jgi:predicted anti-sigma-YlaC factor YlaD